MESTATTAKTFNKLSLKYEKCNTKGLIDELEEYKMRYRAYFNKYGNLE